MCKHDWQLLMPPREQAKGDQWQYSVDLMLSRLGGTYYCSICKHTAHRIKSHRGGIKRHSTEGSASIIGRANKILKDYSFTEKNLPTHDPRHL